MKLNSLTALESRCYSFGDKYFVFFSLENQVSSFSRNYLHQEMSLNVNSFCASSTKWGPMGALMGTQKALAAYIRLRQHSRPKGTWQLLGIMLGAAFGVDFWVKLSTISVPLAVVGDL